MSLLLKFADSGADKNCGEHDVFVFSARALYQRPTVIQRCERLLNRVRDKLWRGRGAAAIEIQRTLIASLQLEVGSLPLFYDLGARTASSAAARLLTFLVNNRSELIDYQQARMNVPSGIVSVSRICHEPFDKSTAHETPTNALVNERRSLAAANASRTARRKAGNAFFPHFRSPDVTRQ